MATRIYGYKDFSTIIPFILIGIIVAILGVLMVLVHTVHDLYRIFFALLILLFIRQGVRMWKDKEAMTYTFHENGDISIYFPVRKMTVTLCKDEIKTIEYIDTLPFFNNWKGRGHILSVNEDPMPNDMYVTTATSHILKIKLKEGSTNIRYISPKVFPEDLLM